MPSLGAMLAAGAAAYAADPAARAGSTQPAPPVFEDTVGEADDRIKKMMAQLKIEGKYAFLLHDNQGLAALTKGDLALAAVHFKRAIAKNPGYSEAYDHLAQTKELSGDLEGALDDYTQALRIDPVNMAHYTAARGSVLMGLNRHEEALKDFDRAITQRPKSPSLLRHRSLALASLGRFEEAGREYQKAFDLNPGIRLPDDKLFCEKLEKEKVAIAACK